MLESAGVSWISVSWSLFPGDVLITSQIIVVSGEGTERNITLEGNGTSVNITSLQSGTEYSIRVTAVASDGLSRVEYNTEKNKHSNFSRACLEPVINLKNPHTIQMTR